MSKKISKEEAKKKVVIKLKKHKKVKIKDAQAVSDGTDSTGPRFKNKDTGL